MNEATLDPSEVSARLNVGAAAEEPEVREEDRVRSGRACTLFAVVEPDGTLARGCGAVSSQKVDIDVGAYEVIFDRNVRDCAYVATIGISGSVGFSPSGEITVAGRFNNVNGVFLTTSDSTGMLADRGFHVAVHCCC
jgi:hypothetical protein